MPQMMPNADNTNPKIEVTLQIDPQVYEAFLRKSQQANMDIETFLSSTLTIVLGCRVFQEKYAAAPHLAGKDSCTS